ncbi:20S proteasome beta subunit [Tribonema minus]|uniref:Proteasome subunit beta n=1 Tax=Tribonema minus TaxID=303371 RepID=A0A835Z5Q8_9STRA|nr:20S proteasome beta subunit [Tribonema minus]
MPKRHWPLYLSLALFLRLLLMIGLAPSRSHGAPSQTLMDAPRQRTQSPIVTGTSVIGLKYKDGVMLAADTLASYGSLARYKSVERIRPVGESTLLGASGEYSDFQAIMEMLEDQTQEDRNMDDGFKRAPAEVHSYLRAVMYNRRNKMNPLWNYLLIAGVNPRTGGFFLGSVDHIGTAYEDDILATGFGAHLALPILRRRWRADMEEGEARALLEDCMRVLFYRDCRALNRIQIAKATREGVLVSDPYTIETSWSLAAFAQPKAGADTDGSW